MKNKVAGSIGVFLCLLSLGAIFYLVGDFRWFAAYPVLTIIGFAFIGTYLVGLGQADE
jgi:hypothetical protein